MSGPREWSPRKPEKRTLEIKSKIQEWMDDNKLSRDAHIYTPKEWEDRGEKYGEGSLLTIAAEGSFYRVMNDPESWSDKRLREQFVQMLNRMGLWFEQGYSWTWHIYPKDSVTMGESVQKKPLLTVLSTIQFTQPRMVLMQGRSYFRIEDLIDQARRDAANDAAARASLEAQIYSAEKGPDGKLVIWRDAAGGRKATFVEPGSTEVTDP